MAHYLVRDCSQPRPVRRFATDLPGYRFGWGRDRHARGPSALHRANSYLKALIQSIADARFRRMLRELEVGGARLDVRDEPWIPDALRGRDTLKQPNARATEL